MYWTAISLQTLLEEFVPKRNKGKGREITRETHLEPSQLQKKTTGGGSKWHHIGGKITMRLPEFNGGGEVTVVRESRERGRNGDQGSSY